MILRAVDLVKSYHGRAVINGVSLEVGQGEVVGLLGPNARSSAFRRLRNAADGAEGDGDGPDEAGLGRIEGIDAVGKAQRVKERTH
jgi:ATPase subunit of ABC transporter with duplicated ATPase domains